MSTSIVPFVKLMGRHVKKEIDAGGALVGGRGEFDLERLAALVLHRGRGDGVQRGVRGKLMQAIRTWRLRAARGHGHREGRGNGQDERQEPTRHGSLHDSRSSGLMVHIHWNDGFDT